MHEVRTTRKLQVLGTEQYVNTRTGELVDCQVAQIGEVDTNFHKFWLKNLLFAIDEISNQKTKVALYIFDNVDYANNTLIMTGSEIIKNTGISRATVFETLKILEKHDIIRRKLGAIFLNPNVLFKGGTAKRRAVMLKYTKINLDQKEIPGMFDEAELEALQESA